MKNLLIILMLFFVGCEPLLAVTWADLEPNLILWYEFEDNCPNTTVLDSSGNGYHGTASVNTNQLSTAGKVGKGFAFDGTVDVNCLTGLEDTFKANFSVVVWVKEETDIPGSGQATNIITPIGTDNFVNFGIDTSWRSVWSFYSANGLRNGSGWTETGPAPYTEPDMTHWFMAWATFEQNDSDVISKVGFNLTRSDTSDPYECVMADYISEGSLVLSRPDGSSLDNFMVFNKALSDEELEVVYKKSKPNGYVLIGR